MKDIHKLRDYIASGRFSGLYSVVSSATIDLEAFQEQFHIGTGSPPTRGGLL